MYLRSVLHSRRRLVVRIVFSLFFALYCLSLISLLRCNCVNPLMKCSFFVCFFSPGDLKFMQGFSVDESCHVVFVVQSPSSDVKQKVTLFFDSHREIIEVFGPEKTDLQKFEDSDDEYEEYDDDDDSDGDGGDHSFPRRRIPRLEIECTYHDLFAYAFGVPSSLNLRIIPRQFFEYVHPLEPVIPLEINRIDRF